MKGLFKDNEIRNFSADGIRPNSSDLLIDNNKVLDAYVSAADGDGNHDDGIQSFASAGFYYDNVTISNNWIQETTSATRPLQSPLQGIFIEAISHFTVINNVVIVSAPHGISFNRNHDILVANNTLVPAVVGAQTFIRMWDYFSSLPAVNIVIKNNLAPAAASVAATTVPTSGYILSNNFAVTDPVGTYVLYNPAAAGFDPHIKSSSLIYGKGAGAL